MKTNGDVVTGSFMGPAGRVEFYDGKVGVDTISFKFKSPEGLRIITITGKVAGDEIMFTRDVEILPGGTSGGGFIFGTAGARTITATRVQ